MTMDLIYADNAATTKLDPEAYNAMIGFFEADFGNPSQPYSFSRRPKKALRDARSTIEELLGVAEGHVFFTSGGSESNNWVIKCFGKPGRKKMIITSCIEHHSVIRAVESLKAQGAEIYYLSVDSAGLVSKDQLRELLAKKTDDTDVLVSVMMANNEIGTIEPIKELVDLAHSYGAFFHTDAVQAVGHVPLNIEELGVDYLSASAHKFHGPKGIGFLYCRNTHFITPLINGGSQEMGERAGTENVALVVGMTTALANSLRRMPEAMAKLNALENSFLSALEKMGIDYIRNGSANHLPGLINISLRNAEGEMLLHRLDLMGILISTGSACDSKETQVSHVIKAIGVSENYSKGTIRISLGYENSEDEVVKIVESIKRIIISK